MKVQKRERLLWAEVGWDGGWMKTLRVLICIFIHRSREVREWSC